MKIGIVISDFGAMPFLHGCLQSVFATALKVREYRSNRPDTLREGLPREDAQADIPVLIQNF